MKLPTINDIQIPEGLGLVRADLDLSFVNGGLGGRRIEVLLPTLNSLFEKGADKLLLIGHKGRPKGKFDEAYSLAPIVDSLKKEYFPDTKLIEHRPTDKLYLLEDELFRSEERLLVLENLRFWREEVNNDKTFIEELAYLGSFYVNEAFASSHRDHASIVGVPKKMREDNKPVASGLRFQEEVDNLVKVLENPKKPLVFIISGLKKDKLEYIDEFKNVADQVMVAGRLPEHLPDGHVDPRVFVSRLMPDKEDITVNSIEAIEAAVRTAGTVVVSGPIGKFEDPGHRLGTERIFRSVANSKAFSVAGGGETEKVIEILHLDNEFNWVSVGGGAMLEFLAKGTLPGIEALLN